MSLMKSLDWLFGGKGHEPFDKGDDWFLEQEGGAVLDNGQKVILQEQTLETDRIKKYVPAAESKKVVYEPKDLKGYIGQEEAKNQITTAVKIINELRPIHILLNGWAGCGKTLLAKITCDMLNARFIYRVPEQLKNMDDLLAVINQIQEHEGLTVFMLDEIHTIDTALANVLLPILQDLKYGDVDIRPFVMIGATTDRDKLDKRQSPLVSRFQFKVTLTKYKPNELATIIKNYKEALYPNMTIQEQDYLRIAENSRGVPREAIALLLKLLVLNDVDKVLGQSNIIKDGLTSIDAKILRVLAENEKPMGANYLSQAVGIPQSDYEEIYERYLVEQGYIARQARGRTIREKGKKFLQQIGG